MYTIHKTVNGYIDPSGELIQILQESCKMIQNLQEFARYEFRQKTNWGTNVSEDTF